MPKGSIDTHMHVIGPFDRFPLSPKSKYEPFEATWREQKEILTAATGFGAFVVVQSTSHGEANEIGIDALEHWGGSGAAVGSQRALAARG